MIVAAAEVSLFGLDPMDFLETKDPLRRGLMQNIAYQARIRQRQYNHELANMIAAEIMKMLAASFKK
jgi:hypothetical protein